jgi:hypothetical protein
LQAQLIPYKEQLQTVSVENNSKEDDEKLTSIRKRLLGIFKCLCLIRSYLFKTLFYEEKLI